MPIESHQIEYKSLKKVEGPKADFRSLAETCVAFANAQGGLIVVGIEDQDEHPPAGQKINQATVNHVLKRLRGLTDSVGLGEAEILNHENGAEYFRFRVFPTTQTVAASSEGKILLRIGEECLPIKGQDLVRLVSEKNAFQWELTLTKFSLSQMPVEHVQAFTKDIRQSERVKPHIKQMSDPEILEHYNLIEEQRMTNLGVLWLGESKHRSRLTYPLTVQYIVHDAQEEKIRKEEWNDYRLNPKEMILDIEEKALELKYFYEFPHGFFRQRVHFFDPRLVRELLINAFAHKSYTISGDIFINVYPDRLEIKNPGLLPLGITKDNILHSTHRRNPHIIRILHDLKLMEGEGSGYDLIYELDARDSKPFPEVISRHDYTNVIQSSGILNEEVMQLMDYVSEHFQLTQRNLMVLGIVARERKILTTQLSKELQLTEEQKVSDYVKPLLDKQLLIAQGHKKGTEYLINPKLEQAANLNQKTSLKTIVPHRLKALIEEDLRLHPASKMDDIHKRLPDLELKDLQKLVYSMVKDNILLPEGGKTYRRYTLAKKNRNSI